ncbi:MAG: hypothetical protein K0R90_1568 [Oscillospiraceae bacterium]|nr:hypothetical protein [Oscillospiraceae bacterium]
MDYKTIKERSCDSFVEKKSKFIGYICSVTTEQEAIGFINEIKQKHWDATHNVYAYILRDGQIKRYSDDGEPQGTAGIPALDVLQKEELTDVCVVVTRYFGGTMLGAGGLVRAYSHSVKIAVDSAQILNMTVCKVLTCEMDYSFHGKISYILPKYYIKTLSSDFGAEVILQLLIKSTRVESFLKEVTEITNGQVAPYEIEERYSDME